MTGRYPQNQSPLDRALVDLKDQLLQMQDTVKSLESMPAVGGHEDERWEILCIHLEWLGACAEELLSRQRGIEDEVLPVIH
ncbi:hypothetical protein SAMN05428969_1932 [Devosia sp. YR412]|uniref:hypothetical protein n=1 Tax=Devosia sp. YR412 TaxID=1881030 RepID=UPI0008C13D99|nr:hypothetical protein [Devosia sp. YR412]SEQ09413.1 hypothetical protein SAMN05428969_1932 [Devosia sp. YR412]